MLRYTESEFLALIPEITVFNKEALYGRIYRDFLKQTFMDARVGIQRHHNDSFFVLLISLMPERVLTETGYQFELVPDHLPKRYKTYLHNNTLGHSRELNLIHSLAHGQLVQIEDAAIKPLSFYDRLMAMKNT